jgi:hypothetical protein
MTDNVEMLVEMRTEVAESGCVAGFNGKSKDKIAGDCFRSVYLTRCHSDQLTEVSRVTATGGVRRCRVEVTVAWTELDMVRMEDATHSR